MKDNYAIQNQNQSASSYFREKDNVPISQRLANPDIIPKLKNMVNSKQFHKSKKN